ncbi:MAG TPA: hypothetical protein VNN21_08455 [Dehalococcoidia bacterium]|nr:hypothetical protein [Dehalococcoidia bacterium]
MRIQPGQMIALGYGKYVRSDEVIAVEPITESRGPKRRALVWVRGIDTPLVASRSEGAIVDDLTTPAEEALRVRQQRAVLQRVVKTVDEIPGAFRRRLRESDGIDLDALAQEANRILA